MSHENSIFKSKSKSDTSELEGQTAPTKALATYETTTPPNPTEKITTAQDFSEFILSNLGSNTTNRSMQCAIAAWTISPWYRSVIEFIATQFASVQWGLYKLEGQPDTMRSRAYNYRTKGPDQRFLEQKEMIASGELVLIENNPLMDKLNLPNAVMTGGQARKLIQLWRDITGEAYIQKIGNGIGGVDSLQPIPPHWIQSLPSSKKPYYEVRINSQIEKVVPEEMIFFRSLNPLDPYGRSVGTGQALGDEIETDEYSAKFIKSTLVNRGKPEAIISIEGMKATELQRAKDRFNNEHQGFWNSGKNYWQNGKVSVEQLSQTFQELELLEQRTWIRNQFIHVYHVPPELLGISEDSNKATSHIAEKHFYKFVNRPNLETFKETMQQQLIDPIDPRLVLDYVDPRPADSEEQLAAMEARPETVTIGEWRLRQGLKHRGEEDDKHLVDVGVASINSFDEISYDKVSAASDPSDSGASDDSDSSDDSDDEDTNDKAASGLIQIELGGGQDHRPFDGLSKANAATAVNVLDALRPEALVRNTEGTQEVYITSWTNAELATVGSEQIIVFTNPLVTSYMDDYNNIRMVGINNNTKKAMAETLAEGLRAGEGTKKLGKRIKDEMLINKTWRAERIARTETGRASNYGTFEAHKISGLVQFRQWVPTFDTRTRDAHLVLGANAPIPINQPFMIGTDQAMFPGGFAEPQNSIQCRCTTTAHFPEEKIHTMEDLEIRWKAYLEEIAPWEEQLQADFVRAFEQQEVLALAALAANP